MSSQEKVSGCSTYMTVAAMRLTSAGRCISTVCASPLGVSGQNNSTLCYPCAAQSFRQGLFLCADILGSSHFLLLATVSTFFEVLNLQPILA